MRSMKSWRDNEPLAGSSPKMRNTSSDATRMAGEHIDLVTAQMGNRLCLFELLRLKAAQASAFFRSAISARNSSLIR